MKYRSNRLCAFLFASSVFAVAPPAVQAQQADLAASVPRVVRFGTWGVDISTRDLSVKPGDDFQRYAAGKWLDTHEIPADQASNGVGYETYLRNQERLQSIITGAPKDSQ